MQWPPDVRLAAQTCQVSADKTGVADMEDLAQVGQICNHSNHLVFRHDITETNKSTWSPKGSLFEPLLATVQSSAGYDEEQETWIHNFFKTDARMSRWRSSKLRSHH